MTQLIEIKMLGTMGKHFGRSHMVHLNSKTPSEATRWLMANFPAARNYLATAHEKGIVFAIFRGRGGHRENIGREELDEPAGDCITFAPVHRGSKNGGILQTIIGVVLIVVGVVGNMYGGWGTPFITAGIGMVAGGVVQMLSPKAKISNSNPADQQASYIYSGTVNTTAQGNPAPACYGRMLIGSAVISAGIEAEDYSGATSNVDAGTANGSLAKSPYDSIA